MALGQQTTAKPPAPRRFLNYSRRKRLANVACGLVIGIFLILFLFIFVWMILMSLKDQRTVTAYPPVWIFRPTFKNYAAVFTTAPFAKYLLNSTIIGLFSVAVALVLGLPAAYAAARFRVTGLIFPTLLMRMLPGIAFLVPFFVLFNR